MKQLNELRNIINNIKRKPVYIGLFNQYGEELKFPEYKRILIDFNINISNEEILLTNKETLNFPKSKSNWGMISGFGLYTKERGGSVIQASNINYSRNIYEESTVEIIYGKLIISIPLFNDLIIVNCSLLLNYLLSDNEDEDIRKKITIKRKNKCN